MLRAERAVALDDVIVACQAAGHAYEDAGSIAETPELSSLFRSLSAERDEAAGQLREHIRALGELPTGPNTDRQTLDELFRRLRTLVAADEREALIRELVDRDRDIAARIEHALTFDLPADTISALHALRSSIDDALARLDEIIAAFSGPNP